MDDKEYAVCFEAGSGLEEVNTGATTLTGAKKVAKGYYKDGARNVTIKYYEEGDLRHQWDYNAMGIWEQYE